MAVATMLRDTSLEFGFNASGDLVLRDKDTRDEVFNLTSAGVLSAATLGEDFLGADATGRAAIEADFFNAATVDDLFATGSIGEDILTANELNGRVVANIADANVIGGIPVLFRIDVPDAAGNVDVLVTHKVRVLDAWGLNTGIAAHATNDTWQIKNGANAISDAVAKTATVNALKRIGTIDPARQEIAAGGTLRITAARDTNAAVTVYALAARVA